MASLFAVKQVGKDAKSLPKHPKAREANEDEFLLGNLTDRPGSVVQLRVGFELGDDGEVSANLKKFVEAGEWEGQCWSGYPQKGGVNVQMTLEGFRELITTTGPEILRQVDEQLAKLQS